MKSSSCLTTTNPKLIIAQYYDCLVKYVDIYIEEQLYRNAATNMASGKYFPRGIARRRIIENEQLMDDYDNDELESSNSPSPLPFNCDLDDHHGDSSFVFADIWNKRPTMPELCREKDTTRYDFTLNTIEQPADQHHYFQFHQPSLLATENYLNRIRDDLLSELDEGQKEAFVYYESIRDELKRRDELSSMSKLSRTEKIEFLERNLFAKRSHFLLQFAATEPTYDPTAHFLYHVKIYLVKLDFFLRPNEQELLRELISENLNVISITGSQNTRSDAMIKQQKQNVSFNQETLFVGLIARYITELFKCGKSVRHIIEISKKQLMSVDTLVRNFESSPHLRSIDQIDLVVNESCCEMDEYNFSNIKSLALLKDVNYSQPQADKIKLNSLSGLSGLECVIVRSMKLANQPFANLCNIRKLHLEQCDFELVQEDALRQSMPNLEYLYNKWPLNCAHVSYESMPRLKWLHIERVSKSCLSLVNLSSSLVVLELVKCSIDSSSCELLQNLEHPGLRALNLSHNYFDYFDGVNWLCGLPNLKALNLAHSSIKTITFGDHLAGLESICLRQNRLESLHASFGKLVNLRSLDLYRNRIKLTVGMFESYEKLEDLNLRDALEYRIRSINKQVFRGLKSLKSLNLGYNKLVHLDHEMFAYMPRLKRLYLKANKLTLESNTFAYLKELKYLDLSSNCLRNLPDGVFSSFVRLKCLDLSDNYGFEINQKTFDWLMNLMRSTAATRQNRSF